MPGMMDMLIPQMTGMAPGGGGSGGGMPGPPTPMGGGPSMPFIPGGGGFAPDGRARPGISGIMRGHLMERCQNGDMQACEELKQSGQEKAPGGWGMSSGRR